MVVSIGSQVTRIAVQLLRVLRGCLVLVGVLAEDAVIDVELVLMQHPTRVSLDLSLNSAVAALVELRGYLALLLLPNLKVDYLPNSPCARQRRRRLPAWLARNSIQPVLLIHSTIQLLAPICAIEYAMRVVVAGHAFVVDRLLLDILPHNGLPSSCSQQLINIFNLDGSADIKLLALRALVCVGAVRVILAAVPQNLAAAELLLIIYA